MSNVFSHRHIHRVKDVLVLDDEEYRHSLFRSALVAHRVTHVYTVVDAMDVMRGQKFNTVFLDHDLGDHQLTGSDLVNWMVTEMPVENHPDRVVIHSLNPYGASAMYAGLNKFGFHVEKIPFRSEPIRA